MANQTRTKYGPGIRPALSLLTLMTILLLSINHVDARPKYRAVGSTLSAAIFDEWMFAFNLMKPDCTFSYEALGNLAAIRGLTLSQEFDFAVSDVAISPAQRFNTTPADDVLQIPLLASPMVMFYNLPYPGLSFTGSSVTAGRLKLDRKTAAAIWAHQIDNWRHPEILALQDPDIAAVLPNSTIYVGIRTNGQTILQIIHKSMNAFAQSGNRPWPWGTTGIWSPDFLDDAGVLITSALTGVRSLVTLNANSMGIAPYSEVVQDGQLNFAAMWNKNGDFVTRPDVQPALENMVWDSNMASDSLIDNSAPGTWPMGALQYTMLRISNYTSMDCDTRRNLVLFFHWVLTAKEAKQRMKVLGYSSLPETVVEMVLTKLSTLSCPDDGRRFLDREAIPDHASIGYTIVYALTYIFAATTSFLVIYYLIRDYKRISMTAMIFFLLLLLGSLFNYASAIAFFQTPKTDAVCQSRLWFGLLGFTMMLSALFCRGYQIHAVHETSKQLGKRVKHTLIQVGGNCAIVLVQLILLIAWNQVNTFKAIHDQVDDLDLRYGWICRSDNTWAWWGAEILFVVILLGFGLYVVYKTWDLKHMVKESKWISVSIYNCIVVLVLLLALFSSLSVIDDTVFWLAGGSTLFLTVTTMLALFLPRALAIKELADLTGSQSGSQAGSHIGSKMGSQISPGTPKSINKSGEHSPRTSKFGPGKIPTNSLAKAAHHPNHPTAQQAPHHFHFHDHSASTHTVISEHHGLAVPSSSQHSHLPPHNEIELVVEISNTLEPSTASQVPC